MLGNQAIQTRTINAYTPLYPDSDITFVLKTQPVKYRVPDTYTLSTGNSGHGSVDLPCPPEGIWKWEVIDSEGVVKSGDFAYSPAPLSLFDWLAFGASDSLMAANNLSDVVSAAQAQINLSLLPGTDIPAFTDIPDALTDLDTAVTGAQLDSIKTAVDGLGTMANESSGDFLPKDGSEELTSNWNIGDGNAIIADEIRARDGDGLKLYDDAGNGIFVEDGGDVGIGTVDPEGKLHVFNGTASAAAASSSDNVVIEGSGLNYINFLSATNQVAGILFSDASRARGQVNYSHATDSLRFVTAGVTRVTIASGGNFGIATASPTAALDINSDILRLRTQKTPSSATDTGNAGDWCSDSNYIYVCTATDTWKRTALSTW